eukprot:6332318-Karenia_brevis.AAC.1
MYGGGASCVPHDLTSDQILSGLPPVGVGGTVSLDSLVLGETANWVNDPGVLLKDEADWLAKVSRAKVHCKPENYPD